MLLNPGTRVKVKGRGGIGRIVMRKQMVCTNLDAPVTQQPRLTEFAPPRLIDSSGQYAVDMPDIDERDNGRHSWVFARAADMEIMQ